MPALNFKAQFAEAVASGQKPHSIRAWRRRPFNVGDDLSFFVGMRTTSCRRIRPNTVCTAATPIEVNAHHRYVILGVGSRFYPEGRLPGDALEQLAQRDGFRSMAEFWGFFTEAHGGLVCGQLVEWAP